MVEVTEADRLKAVACVNCPYEGLDILKGKADGRSVVQAFATHRIEAAKAERDRIVAWLRSDKPDRDNGGPCRHVEHSQGTCICNELAEALESQP